MKKLKWAKKGTKCPSCSSSDAFFPIINNGHIDNNIGHCFSCGQNFWNKENIEKKEREVKILNTFYLKNDIYEKLKKNPLTDIFSKELLKKYDGISFYLQRYNVVCGSISGNKFWRDFTGFPKIDISGKVRSIKCFKYANSLHTDTYVNPEGKTVKKINWLHTLKKDMVNTEKEIYIDCFFGEHLIFKTEYKYIGIVESEKSAIIGNYFFGKDWIFLAIGSKTNIKKVVYKGINDKKVVFFPDADAVQLWSDFLNITNKSNFILSNYCKKLTNKLDIADIFLETENGNKLIDSVNVQLSNFEGKEENIEIAEKKITNFEIDFYDSIFKNIFTSKDIEKVLSDNDISLSNIHLELKILKTTSFVNIKLDGISTTLYEIFLINNKENEFYNLLKIKHIPKYEWVKDFSFSFSNEEFLNYLNSFNDIFFNDLIYNITDQAFIQCNKIINDFELLSHIRQTYNMLLKSNLNEKRIKYIEIEKLKIIEEWCKDIENKRISEISFNKTIGEKYINILKRGNEFLNEIDSEKSAIESDKVLNFINQKMHNLFDITDFDILQLVFFCASSIRKKFYYEYQWGKLLILNGDSGVGKDTFFPSLLSGSYVIENEQIFSDKQKVGNFTTLTPSMAKKLLYTVISDDVEASNSFGINDITNPTYVINNKSIQMIVVRNSFNKIITSNPERIIFNKELDKNAIARRYINVKIKYLSGNDATDYLYFFKTHGEKFYQFYELFFTYAYKLAEDIEALKSIENAVIKYNYEIADKLIYLNNDDNIVLEKFQNKIDICIKENFSEVLIRKIKDVDFYVLRNFNYDSFSPKKEYSVKKIKEVLQLFYKTLKFGKVININNQSERCDIIEVAEYQNLYSNNRNNNNNNTEKVELKF